MAVAKQPRGYLAKFAKQPHGYIAKLAKQPRGCDETGDCASEFGFMSKLMMLITNMSVAYRAIKYIDQKTSAEEEWLNTLTESLKKSDHLKQNMIELLDSFSTRLSTLESTVLPMYEHTGLLQQRQLNIMKTLKTVDSTLAHYSSVAELDSVLRNYEPNDDIDKYLKNMGKLKDAMKYFADNDNSKSTHLDNAKGTFEFGCSALEREFKEILRKNSTTIKPTMLLEVISDDYEIDKEKLGTVDLMPVKDVELLAKVAQWLVNNGTSTDFTNFYSDYRSLYTQKLMQNIIDHFKSNTTPPTNLKFQASPLMTRKDLGASKAQNIRKASRTYASDLAIRRTTTLAVENVTKESSMETESENFLLSLCCLLACVIIENELIQRIFGVQKDLTTSLMKNVINKSTNFVLSIGDVLLAQIQKSLSKQDHAAILCLFPLAKYLHGNDRRFDLILKFCSNSAKNKFVELPKAVDSLCVKGLEDFVEHVKIDEDKFVPKDGTVHQVTSNALIFLEQLMQIRDCILTVLSSGQMESATNLVPKYFARVLSALGLNLRNKAELYTSANFTTDYLSLKAVFMLNNFNHILRTLQKSGVMKLLVYQQNREIENFYFDQIKQFKKQYLAGWSHLLVILMEFQQKFGIHDSASMPIFMQNVKLKDKEREILKNTFSEFNKEFEILFNYQNSYSVPDKELAQQLRRETKEIILPKYTPFYNCCHSTNFSKNPEKYVKYTPQDLIRHFDQLFSR
uniref:Exocyst complex component 7 n=1 Tax=Romanomermis culicivorax TaxID=13658 RepID=A0A915KX25_ROMCU